MYTSLYTSSNTIVKKCWIDSCRIHPQHFKIHFYYFLAKLSLVRAMFLIRYNIKILIFSGNLSFQMGWLHSTTFGAANTLKCPCCCKDHRNVSLCPVSWILISLATSWCHEIKLWPTNKRLKDTFNGFDLNTMATVALFFRTMLYRSGYKYFKSSIF